MAKFVKQTSDVAMALNRLQGLAEGLISMETRRRIQLGKEKETRVADAYKYLIGQENAQIREYETAIDTTTQNLLDRGIELESVKDQYKTVDSEFLLNAANESAIGMLNVMLDDAKNQSDSYRTKMRDVNKVKRHIDLFDDAISLVDPSFTGDPRIVDATDVAKAAMDFAKGNEKYGPEIEQRLKELQTEGQLERLQEDYYAKLARESKEKISAHTAATTDATIKMGMLEDVKKETLEGVKAMTYQPVSSLVEQYRPAITLQSEIASGEDALTGESLNPTEVRKKQDLQAQEYTRLGVILAPWAFSRDQAALEAQNLQASIVKAGNGNYQDLINYLKKGHSQYMLWVQEGNQISGTYRADIQRVLGIDIASKEWISQLEELWWSVAQADIEQATEALKAGRQFLPEFEDGSDDEGRKDDLELFMGGDW